MFCFDREDHSNCQNGIVAFKDCFLYDKWYNNTHEEGDKMAKSKIRKTVKPMIFMVVGCAMMWILFSSAMTTFSRQEDIARLEKEVEAIQAEKAALENQVELLNDDDYVTRYARENYVFTREGEKVVILPDADDSK